MKVEGLVGVDNGDGNTISLQHRHFCDTFRGTQVQDNIKTYKIILDVEQ